MHTDLCWGFHIISKPIRKRTLRSLASGITAYEKKGERLLPFPKFLGRLGMSILAALLIVAFALLVGIVGYHYIAHLDWIDAILNASMILTGMGPVNPMIDVSSKLFASAYAVFSGVVFLT